MWPNQLRQTVSRDRGSSRRTAALQQHHSITQARSGTATLYNSKAHISAERDLRRLQFCSFRGRAGQEPCKQQAYSISTHWDSRISLAKARMGMDGNHANNTNSHFNRSPCTTSTRGGRKPLQKQHTAYIIQHTTGPQDVCVCSGNGDGWKPWKQHLHTSAPSLKRNSIYI